MRVDPTYLSYALDHASTEWAVQAREERLVSYASGGPTVTKTTSGLTCVFEVADDQE